MTILNIFGDDALEITSEFKCYLITVIIWQNLCNSRATPMSPPVLVTSVVFNSWRELRGPTFLPPRLAIQILLFKISDLAMIEIICRNMSQRRMILTWEFGRKYSSLYDADFYFTSWENF